MKYLLSIGLLFMMIGMVQAQKIPASDNFFRMELGPVQNDGIGNLSEMLNRLHDHSYISGEKPVGSGHYAAHRLNNELREKYRCSVTYITGGWAFKIPYLNAPFTLEDIIKRVDYTLPGDGLPVKHWNDQPSYLLDELAAYINGTIVGLEAGLAGTASIQMSARNSVILLHFVQELTVMSKEAGYSHAEDLELFFQHYLRVYNTRIAPHV
jgi:hypothetical protein